MSVEFCPPTESDAGCWVRVRKGASTHQCGNANRSGFLVCRIHKAHEAAARLAHRAWVDDAGLLVGYSVQDPGGQSQRRTFLRFADGACGGPPCAMARHLYRRGLLATELPCATGCRYCAPAPVQAQA